MQQLKLWSESPVERRSSRLEFLFQHLNRKHWGGKLPSYRCEWSDRMITTWGCCYPGKRTIRISSFFQRRPLAELIALMSHEMIHIHYRGHGARFMRELKRIGLEGDVEKRFPHLTHLTEKRRRSYRYIYECPRCKMRILRRKRIDGYCRKCFAEGGWSRFQPITLEQST